MANIFDTAQEFYLQNPQAQIIDKRRKLYTKELLFVLETAPFLSEKEKSQIQNLIPLYSTRLIKNVKNSLIQQGLTYFQRNSDNNELSDWIKKVSKA